MTRVCALALALAFAFAFAAPAGAQEGKKVMRLGWEQQPQTLNPFIDEDEEDFVIWSVNWPAAARLAGDQLAERRPRLAGLFERALEGLVERRVARRRRVRDRAHGFGSSPPRRSSASRR
jgi:hypothetical protein